MSASGRNNRRIPFSTKKITIYNKAEGIAFIKVAIERFGKCQTHSLERLAYFNFGKDNLI